MHPVEQLSVLLPDELSKLFLGVFIAKMKQHTQESQHMDYNIISAVRQVQQHLHEVYKIR